MNLSSRASSVQLQTDADQPGNLKLVESQQKGERAEIDGGRWPLKELVEQDELGRVSHPLHGILVQEELRSQVDAWETVAAQRGRCDEAGLETACKLVPLPAFLPGGHQGRHFVGFNHQAKMLNQQASRPWSRFGPDFFLPGKLLVLWVRESQRRRVKCLKV